MAARNGLMGSSRVAIYVASPLGFSEMGRDFNTGRLLPLLEDLGYDAIDPWTLTSPDIIAAVRAMSAGAARREAWKRINRVIAENNRGAIARADGLLAVLEGPDVDSGTAAEIGYAYAKGKLIVGYRSDTRLAGDNESAIVNLQVEAFVRVSGGPSARQGTGGS